jgi:enamine deaminase RidA (YjgF/YER057c/UK114 family)
MLSKNYVCSKKKRKRKKKYFPFLFAQKFVKKIMSSKVAARLVELGITLPVAPKPVACYLPFTISGNQLHLCGHLPKLADGTFAQLGQVGKDVTVEQAQAAAQQCIINMLATLVLALGDLDRVKRVLKINVFVSSQPDFYLQPKVADGASELLAKILGPEVGQHARSAVGVAVLPLNVPVEIDAIVEFHAEVKKQDE